MTTDQHREEPVAWRYRSGHRTGEWLVTTYDELAERERLNGNAVEPLYALPVPSPVAVGWQAGERELAARWAASLLAKLSTKPGHEDDCLWLERIAALSASTLSVSEGATHRHVKRGREYVLLGYGKMQAEQWRAIETTGKVDAWGLPVDNLRLVDMREVAIYRSVDDGSLWVRPREEFEDGRFVVLPQPPLSTGGAE